MDNGIHTTYTNMEDYYYDKAIKAYRNKNYDEAIFYCKEIIRKDPNYTDAYFTLGGSYLKLDNFIGAIKSYKKFINQCNNEENLATAYTCLGCSYREMAIFDKAIKYCQQAIEIAPDACWMAYGELAQVYSEKEDFTKAVEFTLKAMSMIDRDVDLNKMRYHYNLGHHYMDGGDLDNSLYHLNQVLQYEEKIFLIFHIDSIFLIGIVYFRKNQYEEALPYMSKAISKIEVIKDDYPDNKYFYYMYNASYHLTQGMIEWVKHNDLEKAKEHFGSAGKFYKSAESNNSRAIKIIIHLLDLDKEIKGLVLSSFELVNFKKKLYNITHKFKRPVESLKKLDETIFYKIFDAKYKWLNCVYSILNLNIQNDEINKIKSEIDGIFEKYHYLNGFESTKMLINLYDFISLYDFKSLDTLPDNIQKEIINKIRPSGLVIDGEMTLKIVNDRMDIFFKQKFRDVMKNLEKKTELVGEKKGTKSGKPSGKTVVSENIDKIELEKYKITSVDFKKKDYSYDFLKIEIKYIKNTPDVTLHLLDIENPEKRLLSKNLEEFERSERNFVFLVRLAVARLVNKDKNKGWLHKYNKLYIKNAPNHEQEGELQRLYKCLKDSKISFLEKIAENNGLDEKEFKRFLIKSSRSKPDVSIKLAIPNIEISEETIENLRRFEYKESKTMKIELPRKTIAIIKNENPNTDNRLRKITVKEVAEKIMKDACDIYKKHFKKDKI